ncbi:HAMP domain-containing histidine kinase [Massilia litorea]|uniref:histidine kinase n=1 Tax=Massilia litorea TaxID=2769491 RepID=A0A7L9UAP6_9BURK|nr:HAMP domain-containing histidine kinase [Massilia litorea]
MARLRKRPAGRLFWKFFLSILLAQIAAAAGIGSYFWLREQAHLKNSVIGIETGPPAAFMLDSAAVALKYGGLPALREIVRPGSRHTVLVVDPKGRELLEREVAPAVLAQARRELDADRPFQPVRELVAPDGRRLLAFVPRQLRAGPDGVPLADRPGADAGPRSHGDAHTGAGGPRGPFGPGWQFSKPIPLLASVIVSLLFAFLLAWYFSRPIRALRNAFEAAAAGDLAPRFADARRGGDELKDLGRDFDRMSARLRALMDGQRRLLHDVSHELRSPLARLQAAIGLAHQQPDKIATSLARIERESVRMDKLVGELLTLSRLEANPELPKAESIDMAELLDGIASDVRFEAGEDGPAIHVDIEGEAQVAVRGEPDLLWRAIENVVRNAVRHGGAGGSAEIRLRADMRFVQVEVLDRGPGIAPADLPTIFQPFFRSNPSNNNVDGHGLGLAIAERVVHAHGGTIQARNREGGGLQVAIALPRTPRARTSNGRTGGGIPPRPPAVRSRA